MEVSTRELTIRGYTPISDPAAGIRVDKTPCFGQADRRYEIIKDHRGRQSQKRYVVVIGDRVVERMVESLGNSSDCFIDIYAILAVATQNRCYVVSSFSKTKR